MCGQCGVAGALHSGAAGRGERTRRRQPHRRHRRRGAHRQPLERGAGALRRAPPCRRACCLITARDAAVLPLLPRLIEAGVPVLGVCRGFQEINVAFGGTLDPAVHEPRPARPSRRRSRPRPSSAGTTTATGSTSSRAACWPRSTAGDACRSIRCITRASTGWGSGLRVEATAPDGLVEAFSVAGAPAFTLAVQWHPEMRIHDCPLARPSLRPSATHAAGGAYAEASRPARQQPP